MHQQSLNYHTRWWSVRQAGRPQNRIKNPSAGFTPNTERLNKALPSTGPFVLWERRDTVREEEDSRKLLSCVDLTRSSPTGTLSVKCISQVNLICIVKYHKSATAGFTVCTATQFHLSSDPWFLYRETTAIKLLESLIRATAENPSAGRTGSRLVYRTRKTNYRNTLWSNRMTEL